MGDSDIIFIIVLILGISFCIYRILDKKNAEEEDEEDKATFIKAKERLLLSKHRKLLENFITKCNQYPKFNKYWGCVNFGDFIDATTEAKEIIPRVVSEEETELFTKLLNTKGFSFDKIQVEEILSELIDKQAYDEIKGKILANHPKNIVNFVKNFLNLYGEDFIHNIGHIAINLLKENNIDCNYEDLQKIVDEIKISHLEKNLNSKSRQYISINDIDLMNGFDFERFLKMLFEKMGYVVKHTKLTGDQGADLVIEKFGKTTVVQAKRYSGNISNKAVQEVVASIKHYDADDGMVVTSSDFTPSAVKLADSNKVDLINREKLAKLISKYL